jgi:hypothetical protein
MNRKSVLLALAFVSTFALAQSVLIMAPRTTTGAGTAVDGTKPPGIVSRTYQVIGSVTAGTGTAVVSVKCSQDGTHFKSFGTVTLAITATATDENNSDFFTSSEDCAQLQGYVSSIAGTTTVSVRARH